MLALAFLLIVTAPAPVSAGPSRTPFEAVASTAQPDDLEEYKARREAAGKDVAKLWELVDWCDARGFAKETKSCLRAIVRETPDDKKARELLGHIYFEGQWFETEKKLEKYKAAEAKKRAKEEAKLAKEKGLVRYGNSWVEPADLPYLEKGMVRNEYGEWIDPLAAKRLAEGWVQQDLLWISPEEVENVHKGLWKCGDKWLSEADANAYHADLFRWWEIPTDHFTLRTTCARKDAEKIGRTIDDTYRDLVRLFGITPVGKPLVVVLNSIDQYNTMAAGDEGLGIRPTESTGWSSANSTFFADVWFTEDRKFEGAGVTYWNAADENDVRFANHWVRHAAGQSFIEGIDPSRESLASFATESTPRMERFVTEFWREKALPQWLRYGAATYVERYFVDTHSDDKEWAKKWSIGNILNKGGMDPVSTLLAFRIDLGSQEGADAASKLFNQSGLLMSFVLDGKSTSVKTAHGAFKAALKQFRDDGSKENRSALDKAARSLGDALRSSEGEIRAYGGL